MLEVPTWQTKTGSGSRRAAISNIVICSDGCQNGEAVQKVVSHTPVAFDVRADLTSFPSPLHYHDALYPQTIFLSLRLIVSRKNQKALLLFYQAPFVNQVV